MADHDPHAQTFGDPADAQYIGVDRSAPHVLVVRIARAAKRNALSNPMVVELGRVLTEAAADPEVRAVVIAGDDTVFCAGADLANMRKYGAIPVVSDRRRIDAWSAIEAFPKPLVAAVNGVAMGAGNELVLCCDMVIAGSNARFAQPEVKVGGMAGDGGTQRLPRKLGPQMAAYMLLTGEDITAADALRLGYVLEVCEPSRTLARAIEVAQVIASRAPVAVKFTKACMKVAVNATLQNGLAFERVSMLRNHGSADRLEGLKAFEEKRAPNFTGIE